MSTAAPEVDKRSRLLTGSVIRLGRPRLDLSFLVLVLAIGLAASPIVTGLGLNGPLVRDPHAVNLFGNPTGPGASHPLGVDGSGRDVLSRILFGLRSLVLVCLAASALAGVLSAALAGLAALNPWLGWLRDMVLAALGAYPALLLGLAVGVSLSGDWRLIVPIALIQMVSLSAPRELPAAVGLALARAVGTDFGLTFLGLGPGGSGPQLGAMVARAGDGIAAGVPAWWALLFPGLALMLILVAAQSLAWASASRLTPLPRHRVTRSPLADQLIAGAVQLIAACGLAAVAFRGLGGSDQRGGSALAGVAHGLGASGSLLLGGLVVWALATWLHLRLSTRGPRRRGGRPAARVWRWFVRALAHAPAVLVAAAPVGWLAFLAIYVFSESVGKLPVLPGVGTYVGVTQDPGRWAQSLVIPWLLLGLAPAAWTAGALDRSAVHVAQGPQQRVARAAGVPEAALARQRRRALRAPLLDRVAGSLPGFVGAALVIEVTFAVPGAGALIREAFSHGQAATVSDLAVLVTAGVIVAAVCLRALSALADPRAARR